MQPVRFDHFHPTSTQTMVNYKDTLASYCPANRVTYDLTRMQCISHSLSPLRVRPKLTIKTNSASNVFHLFFISGPFLVTPAALVYSLGSLGCSVCVISKVH